MKNLFEEPLGSYKIEKEKSFKNNTLASKFRNEYPKLIESLIEDKDRYVVVGSSGKGNWAECPWIAILDTLVTQSAQSGYYPVYLFKSDMTGVYLSLNQGVTEVQENYKSDAKNVLGLRAEDFRARLEYDVSQFEDKIALNSKTGNARLYEAGNILAKFYSAEDLPDDTSLRKDLFTFLELYDQLTYSDSGSTDNEYNTFFENKKVRLHWRIERSTSLSKKVKKIKGYRCEACGLKMEDLYGELGQNFIEAHHLTPISELDIGLIQIDPATDFAVLCSNCHSMIHKMNDPSDVLGLKNILRSSKKQN